MFLYTRIISSLHHHKWSFYPVYIGKWRDALQESFTLRSIVITHAFTKFFTPAFPISWDRFQQRDKIRWAYHINTRRIYIRSKRKACKRSITTIASPHDTNTLLIDNAFVYKIFNAPGNIVLH